MKKRKQRYKEGVKEVNEAEERRYLSRPTRREEARMNQREVKRAADESTANRPTYDSIADQDGWSYNHKVHWNDGFTISDGSQVHDMST